MSAAAVQMCKYGPKDCPFGVVCKFNHGKRASKASKPDKARNEVVKHKNAIMKASADKPKGKDSVGNVIQKHPHLQEAKRRTVLLGMVKQSKDLSSRRLGILKQKADFDQKYVLVNNGLDVKTAPASPFDDALRLIDMEFKTMKTMARNVFGLAPIKWNFFIQQTLTCNSTGLLNAVFAVDPTTLTEFLALVPLFDEYRVVGGKSTGFFYGPMLANATSAVPIAGLVYDSVDPVALVSVPDAMANAQHRLFACPVISSSTLIAATTQVTTESVHRLESFEFKVPTGVLEDSVYGQLDSGSWQAMAPSGGTYLNYGVIKTFGANFRVVASATSTVVSNFELTMHAELRIRD